ncbi:MAG: FAD-binding oxidoreductase [Rhodobacteraceae bacterium]|nr:FAD-binding oxidoreductase [Paracoccaceae bacterium]
MSSKYDAIIVGGGIVGASTAYYLARLGVRRVLLIEKNAPAAGGTGKSAAIVRQHYSTRLMARLALQSVEIFETMKSEFEAPNVFFQTGYHMLVPPELLKAAKKNVECQQEVGVDTEWVDETTWAEHWPWLNPRGIAGVVYEPRGGHADPIRSTELFLKQFRRLGGEVRLKTAARGLLRDGDRVTGVVLDSGDVYAGTVVNAAGPWSKNLAEGAGIELNMRIVREQDSIWEPREGRPVPQNPISNAVDAIYSVPQEGGRILIGQGFPKDYFDVDPNNYKETGEDAFASLISDRAEYRYPGLQGMRLIHCYATLYDVAVDWYPYVGPRAGLDGYVDANGGSGHGFKIAPAIGRELANWIVTGAPADDFRQLSHDRIAAGTLFSGAYGGNRG